jgi:apyrase
MYHWTLLEHGYSMNDENLKKFHIIKNITGTEIGWTLGYMINQTNSLQPDKLPRRLLTKSEFGGLVFLCVFFLLLSIIVALLTRSRFTDHHSFD